MIAKFNSLKLAESFKNRTEKASAIILGDDEKFWIVTLAKMVELIEAGYEVI